MTFTLHHNGKQTLQLGAAESDSERNRRIATICGKEFAEHTVTIEREAGSLKLWAGWRNRPFPGARQICSISL